MILRLLVIQFSLWLVGAFNITYVRPPLADRTFNSSLVNFVVDAIGTSILPQPLGTLFKNCLPNTLDTTVLHAGEVPSNLCKDSFWDTFVITGDIPAMWLRDSMNQVMPYVRLFNASVAAGKLDTVLENFLFGTVHRQASSVQIDSYANAFAWWGAAGQTGSSKDDQTFKEFEYGGGQVNAMQDLRLFERKFEIDSLLSVLKLASSLYDVVPDSAVRRFLADPVFVAAVSKVLDTLIGMLSCTHNPYTFKRSASEPTDTLSHGVGFPCKDTGMVRTHFRPSDDAVVYAFNIPGNAMAAVELHRFGRIARDLNVAYSEAPHSFPWAWSVTDMESRIASLEGSIRAGIAAHGTMQFQGQTIYAYEVDGFGNAIFMDDANVPSLLSLPLLGFVDNDDPLYLVTRRMVLSDNNPWYFKGALGIGGVGGPHVGANHIWPMSLMVQAWTATDVEEVATLLQQLMLTSAPNSLMHESFNKDTLSSFTRPWFAWANTLFGNLVLKVATDPVLYRAANLTEPLDLVALIARFDVEQDERPWPVFLSRTA